MKKILVFYALIVFSFAYSQCYIQGNDTMKIAESATFSVMNATADCADCYSWEIIGANATFEGDIKQSTVKILPNKGGNIILTATLKSTNGDKQCSRNIQIMNNVKLDPNEISANCNISWINYKERKSTDDEVVFESTDKNEKYQFSWTVTYNNGDVKTSNSATPNFKFSKENGISKVVTKITTVKCTRTFTKNYEKNFWSYF